MAVTPLVFYRRYHTYQAILGIYPGENADVEVCFQKTILYVMNWIKSRVLQTVDEAGAGPDDDLDEAKPKVQVPDLIITEAGTPPAFAFLKRAIRVNGKSDQDCSQIFDELIGRPQRQMPIVFVPGTVYDMDESMAEKIDGMCVSMLGFCHVAVWDKKPYKLFARQMNDDSLLEAAEEGKIIFYRNTQASEDAIPAIYLSVQEDPEDPEMIYEWIEEVKKIGYRMPLRKTWCFDGYSFDAPWWNISGMKDPSDQKEISVTAKEQIKLLEERIRFLHTCRTIFPWTGRPEVRDGLICNHSLCIVPTNRLKVLQDYLLIRLDEETT